MSDYTVISCQVVLYVEEPYDPQVLAFKTTGSSMLDWL